MGFVLLIGIVVAYIAYAIWLDRGIRQREFFTALDAATVRQIFEAKVARTGWSIVDDGNPMVAQSSLATGIRQQIGLQVAGQPSGTHVVVGPQRTVRKLTGVPTKAHTLRIRMNSFVGAVQERDRSITPVAR